jgi:deoxyribose-phosphate aldolase
MQPAEVALAIDHTSLKPDATSNQIRRLCAEALEFGFATVCVNPVWVPLCSELLSGSAVGVCAVVGFPLGATLASAKAYEAEQVSLSGASEVDMVLNVGWLKERRYGDVVEDIGCVVAAARAQNALVKVIIEACLLTDEEKVASCVLAQRAGVDFVKTSTGFSAGGATVEDVALMRATVGPDMGIKAAGGIRTGEDTLRMIGAGATRIGASAGCDIVRDLTGNGDGGRPPVEERY